MFALNILIKTRFDLEVAAILARNIPVSDFIQFSLLWFTISLTGIGSVLLGIRASRLFRSGHILSAVALSLLGLALLVPTIGVASYEPVMPVPLLLLVIYVGGLFYGGPWWPFFEGDTFRWIIPFTIVSSTVFGVLLSPLPSTALRYKGAPYVTYVVSRADDGVVLYNDKSHQFATYPAEDLTMLSPCFNPDPLNVRPGWPGRPNAGPACPTARLPK